MKYNKKNRAVLSGILVGLASIGAVASYFDVAWNDLGDFMLGAVLFVAVILGLAALTVVIIKLIARLLNKTTGNQHERDSDNE